MRMRLLALVLVAGGLSGVSGGDAPEGWLAPSAAAAGAHGTLVQDVTVAWRQGRYRGGAQASAVVPGIGQLRVICKRDNTMVQLRPTDRTAESQLWVAKYQRRASVPHVAVKTARVYRYAHAADTSGSGTGPHTHEGLNRRTPIEASSSGYLHGVISSRPGRNRAVGETRVPPATSLDLSWSWSGFGKGRRATCQVKARLLTPIVAGGPSAASALRQARVKRVRWGSGRRVVGVRAGVRTRTSTPLALNWHGDADAPAQPTVATGMAGFGQVELRCETGRDGAASITVVPGRRDSWLWVEEISGEGDVDDHVGASSLGRDPETGRIGPIDLPRNGMLRLFGTRGAQRAALIVSSYRVTNDDEHPERNLCEVAAAPWSP